jgi:hypothetical protein
VAGRRRPWFIPAGLTALLVIVGNVAAIAINAATAQQSPWPFGLEIVRAHPFPSAGILTILAAILGVTLYVGQLRADHDASRRLRPPTADPHATPTSEPPVVTTVPAPLSDLCPVCAAPLGSEPAIDEQTGRFVEPPPLLLHVGWSTDWRYRGGSTQ